MKDEEMTEKIKEILSVIYWIVFLLVICLINFK
jgi:hypothetical protein